MANNAGKKKKAAPKPKAKKKKVVWGKMWGKSPEERLRQVGMPPSEWKRNVGR